MCATLNRRTPDSPATGRSPRVRTFRIAVNYSYRHPSGNWNRNSRTLALNLARHRTTSLPSAAALCGLRELRTVPCLPIAAQIGGITESGEVVTVALGSGRSVARSYKAQHDAADRARPL